MSFMIMVWIKISTLHQSILPIFLKTEKDTIELDTSFEQLMMLTTLQSRPRKKELLRTKNCFGFVEIIRKTCLII